MNYRNKIRRIGVSIATRLGAARSGVRIPADAEDFFLLQNVQAGSGVHLASYSIGTAVISTGV